MSFRLVSTIRGAGRVGWQSIGLGLATIGPLGRVPAAPGTAASLAGLILHLGLQGLPGAWAWAALGALFLVGVWSAGCAERALARRDPPQVVIDEVLGMAVALAGLGTGLLTLAVGFALFRILDVLKPPPIRDVERRLPGGWAVMGDDLAAALEVQLALRILGVFWPLASH